MRKKNICIKKNLQYSVLLGSPICPVDMHILYKSKLNAKSDRLWQKGKQGILHYNDEEWYESRNIGHNPLQRLMQALYKDVPLANYYTNHCIRATVITRLDDCGYEARHITAISGHKNESTIKTYSVKCPDNKKRQMNATLQTAIVPKKNVLKLKHTQIPTLLPTLNMNDLQLLGLTDAQQKNDNNLPPKFKLMPFDDEDQELLDFLEKNPIATEQETNKTNETNINKTTAESAPNPGTSKESIITAARNSVSMTNMSKMKAMQLIPKMLFSNSNVTINYNFNQK